MTVRVIIMSYPSMSEYNETIQNPRLVFTDAELQNCTIQLTPLGMPKVASGGFALTYRLNNKKNHWAVRCFHKEIPGLQKRYGEISSYLRSLQSNFFVSFEYQPHGIKVNVNKYPIVKMDWIDGVLLNTYIEDNLYNNNVLDNLIQQFKKCIKELESKSIAHGDLQHGNIIICANQIKLIDYDGLYVPSMRYITSAELGHINYQHPLRNQNNVGAYIDRFSSIVIYLSLEALKLKPDLWKKYDNGENLLFKRNDYINPNKSPLINEIKAIPQLKSLTENFLKMCGSSFDDIPTLDEFISGNVSVVPAIPYAGVILPLRSRQYPINDANNTPELLKNLGNVVEVIGKISNIHLGRTRYGAGYAFINFGNYKNKGLCLVLWSETLSYLHKQDIDIKQYEGKWVSVSGLITSYKGAPQIVVDRTIKINIIDNAEATAILNDTNGFNSNSFSNSTRSTNKDVINSIAISTKDSSSKNVGNRISTGSTTAVPITPSGSKNQHVLGNIRDNHKKPIHRFDKISNNSNNISNSSSSRSSNSSKLTLPMATKNNSTQSENRNKTSSKGQSNTSDSGCFIATEIYGNINAKEVLILRNWRDRTLNTNILGRKIVKVYYRYSPLLVRKIKDNILIKTIIRKQLDLFIRFWVNKY